MGLPEGVFRCRLFETVSAQLLFEHPLMKAAGFTQPGSAVEIAPDVRREPPTIPFTKNGSTNPPSPSRRARRSAEVKLHCSSTMLIHARCGAILHQAGNDLRAGVATTPPQVSLRNFSKGFAIAKARR